MTTSRYVIQPPSVPAFLYKFNVLAWLNLIVWAKKEYAARLRYHAKRGNRDKWLWLHHNSSAIHVLAELPMFRSLCEIMPERIWKAFGRSEKTFFQVSYEMGKLLAR